MTEPEDLDGERDDIAIIGMAGRFPGAADVDAFWANLRAGVESIRPFTDEELNAAGVDAETRARPDFVNSGSLAEHLDAFDAEFFGVGKREAELMDPQHRVMLEVAWEALERAGYDPARADGPIGLFGGVAPNTYRRHVERVRPELFEAVGGYVDLISSEREYAITRIAHKLDLRGASISVTTACSSSSVALHLACQSLLAGENDLCLVGGARVRVPLTAGYLYTEDGIPSPDGHCRAFDERARGTAIGNGCGMIVLKRLSDAVRDRDWIHAVVRATAINNDGSDKVGFTAPGVRGQSEVIAEALAVAELPADAISYLEAHGTGTAIGDPLEIAAATRAFRRTTDRTGFCAVGSVKTNIGHLDAAAGVTGVIKTALALEHRELPPSLHYESPNPQIDFARSPFFVNDRLRPWVVDGLRRAGVSSFGLGGTNAHAILEEAPPRSGREPGGEPDERVQLLVLSARDDAALQRASERLADHLESERGRRQSLADVAFTLQVGRREFDRRRAVACSSREDAARALREGPGEDVVETREGARARSVAFLFPGGGAQYVGMGRDLYAREPVFRDAVDRCLGVAERETGVDLTALLYPERDAVPSADRAAESERPSRALPLLFAVEYAVAELWRSWGLAPSAMLGHSMGEYTAACLAGVVSVEDAVRIVVERGVLFERLEDGAMLSVALAPDDARIAARPELSIAAVNRPSSCVVSGPVAGVDALQAELEAADVHCTRVHISVAAHSAMVDPILDEFERFMATIPLSPPTVPYVSNVTGTWIEADEATDPRYWVRHLRGTVRFADGLSALFASGDQFLIEAGPGQTLSTFARQHPDATSAAGVSHVVVASLRHPREETRDDVFLARGLGRAFVEGASVDWSALHDGAERGRVPLPTYPFARERHWVDGAPQAPAPVAERASMAPAATVEARSDEPRKERILPPLVAVVEELTGLSPDRIDRHATFLELGFDSLLLTQAGGLFRKAFDVPIGLRQLFEVTPTLDKLATYVDEQLPPEALPAPVVRALPAEPMGPGAADPAEGSTVERVIQQQMALMREQLALLRGEGVEAPAPITASASGSARAPAGEGRLGPWHPRTKDTAGDDLTPRRREALDALVERFNAKTRGSKEWTQAHREHQSDPRSAAGFQGTWKELVYPIVADRAQGSRLVDVDGNEWLDVTMGFGVTLFGHSPDFITEAIREQAARGMAIGPQSTLAGDVTALVCELTGFERAALCNTGSEAVLAAIRTIRTVTGRDVIVMFAGSYHGMFDEVVVRGIGDEGRALPLAPGIPRSAVENVLVLDYGDAASLDVIRSRANEIAAVLVEPIQNRNPTLQPVEFVRELRRVTEELDIALVFDEMVTGFRLHQGGAQAWFGVEADVGTFGKVVGGGMPIGIVAGKARFLDALDGGSWRFGDDSAPEADVTWFAGTFVRHPLACAAARAALQHMKDEGPELQERLNERTARMRDEANAWFEANGFPVRLPGFASQFLIQLESVQPGDLEFGGLYFHFLRDRGIHCHERRPHFLTTAHSDEDIACLLDALRGAAHDMRAGGFFPEPVEHTVPLTDAQQEIWLASRFDADASRAFHLSASLVLEGALDVPALERAIAALHRRHEALRVRIGAAGETQVVAPEVTVGLERVDVAGPDDVEAFHERDAERPFDLERGPLVRFALLAMGETTHRLVVTAHHIVCDGWSLGILMRDLGRLYAVERGLASAPDPPALQFGEFARAQREAADGPGGDASEAYWLEQLGDELPRLDLPTDHTRPAVRTYAGGQRGLRIDAREYGAFKAVASERGTTAFASMVAAYTVLLKRLTSSDDVIVGVATAGQPAAGCGDLVGHCVQLYPLRSRAPRTAPFEEHTRELQAALLDSMDHADRTYGRLLAKLGLPREPGRSPLLSTLVTYETATAGLGFADLDLETANNPKRYCNFDVELYLTEVGDELLVELHYDSALFEAATIDRWLEDYATLLRSIREGDAGTPATELELLGPTERSLLAEWNATEVRRDGPNLVHELFERRARQHPEAVAVTTPTSDGRSSSDVTYGELNERANRLARAFVQHGVEPGDRVALCLPRSPEILTVVLATWKAGACYVPLDPDFPEARRLHALEDSGARLLVTRAGDSIGTFDRGRTFALDAWDPSAFDPEDLELEVDPESVCYVLYTSGSTGVPKGVETPHRAACNVLRWLADGPGFSQHDRLLAVTTVAFDIAVVELWLPLSVGSRVILATAADAADGERLLELIEEHGITLLQATPATFRLLVESGWTRTPGLRIWTCGEPLPADLASEILARAESLWNLYGPTETTIFSTGVEIEADGESITIGGPLANTTAEVLDEHGAPVPIGAIGELVLGGTGVGLGYHGRPELTAERFLPDPRRANGLRYRTGDRVAWTANGRLEFHGRLDHQVKLRGFRIELGEIEAALDRLPDVTGSVVVMREDVPDRSRLVAYVVARDGLDVDALRGGLRASLPDYMIPSAFVRMDELPLTPNRKVDRAALPAPDAENSAPRGFVEPSTETERAVAAIWRDVLDVDRIRAQDDFFDLGGYSLLAARVLTRIRAEFGVDTSLRDLFSAPTVATLAASIDARLRESEAIGADPTDGSERFEIEL